MTKRKFTPPTKFPTEYVNGYGHEVIIYARGKGHYPLIGQCQLKGILDPNRYDPESYSDEGVAVNSCSGAANLHDKPKLVKQWLNVYEDSLSAPYESRNDADRGAGLGRTCVYRIEPDEDGGNPEIFVEDV